MPGLSDSDEAIVAAALPALPQLSSFVRSQLDITRLGGLTNIVFRVVPPSGEPLCLRCPGPGTASYIDRAVEKINAMAAARSGVGPAVMHFGDDGTMLMPLLPGSTMSPATFASVDGAAARAGAALKRLHSSGESFGTTFELFEQIDKYLGELGSDAQLPDGYHATLATATTVKAALAARPLPVAPCHCDPLCENFVDDPAGGVMRIVDFEYGGQNDPMWDLADLSVEAGLDAAKEEELIAEYFGSKTPPSGAERGRIVLYKAMCDLLWTLWGLLQHKNGNPAEDFWQYATERFARCQALMSKPEFAAHVAAVREG